MSEEQRKIPLTKPVWRLTDLSETPDNVLLQQLIELRQRREIRRVKAGKPKKEKIEVLLNAKNCMELKNEV